MRTKDENEDRTMKRQNYFEKYERNYDYLTWQFLFNAKEKKSFLK